MKLPEQQELFPSTKASSLRKRKQVSPKLGSRKQGKHLLSPRRWNRYQEFRSRQGLASNAVDRKQKQDLVDLEKGLSHQGRAPGSEPLRLEHLPPSGPSEAEWRNSLPPQYNSHPTSQSSLLPRPLQPQPPSPFHQAHQPGEPVSLRPPGLPQQQPLPKPVGTRPMPAALLADPLSEKLHVQPVLQPPTLQMQRLTLDVPMFPEQGPPICLVVHWPSRSLDCRPVVTTATGTPTHFVPNWWPPEMSPGVLPSPQQQPMTRGWASFGPSIAQDPNLAQQLRQAAHDGYQ